VHAQIYDNLAIHVDGLISLPFEVAKQAIKQGIVTVLVSNPFSNVY
jgi:hypothetical protein